MSRLHRQAGIGYFGLILILVLLAIGMVLGVGFLGNEMLKLSRKMSNSAFGGVPVSEEIEPGESAATRLIGITLPQPGTYGLDESLEFTAVFSAPVTIRGTVTLPVETTGGVRQAEPVGETTGTRLRFRLIVKMLDEDRNGIGLGRFKADGESSGIFDLNNRAVDLAATPDPAQLSRILIAGSAARAINVVRPGNGSYKSGQTLEFMVKYSRDVVVLGTPTLPLALGPNRRDAVWTPRAALNEGEGMPLPLLVFRYTVRDDDFIPEDGEARLGSMIMLDDKSAIRDVDGNDASRQLSPVDLSGLSIRNPPIPYGVEAAKPGNGRMGQPLEFKVSFTRAVKVTGTPLLPIQISGTRATADYVSGSGGKDLIFRHVVTGGEVDHDGIGVTGAISLNGGTIIDAEGLAARLNLPPTRLQELTVGPFTGYVAVGNYRILASTDGRSWAEHAVGIGVARAVAWGHGTWVAVGDGAVWTSRDATAWTGHSDITPYRLVGVAAGPDGFLITGGADYWATSRDGLSWSELNLPFGKPATSLTRIGDQFAAPTRAFAGAPLLVTSRDGKTLAKRALEGETRDYHALAAGAGRLVMVGARGAILSTDRLEGDWQPVATENNRSLTGIVYANGQFIAVGTRGTILTSPNGDDWTRQDSGTDARLNALTIGPSGIIAAGAEGTLLQSTDGGASWYDRTQPGSDLNGIAYGGEGLKP